MGQGELVADFEFDGSWREFAKIAGINLLLTFATLGIYRYWAKNRVRRYLWSRTTFMGDRLEWAGTGLELFKSGAVALVLFFLPIAITNWGIRRITVGGHPRIGVVLSVLEMGLIGLAFGVAVFRGLRYKLSRTHWRGIRGGSFDPGIRFGIDYVWKNALGMLTLGVMMPWAMVDLWNRRWRAMSFGQWSFMAEGRVSGLKLPFLLCYLAPLVGLAVVLLIVRSGMIVTWFGFEPRTPLQWILIRVPAVFAFFFVFALIVMGFYAAYIRQMVSALSLGQMEFQHNAIGQDWMELYLGDVLLMVGTLGLGGAIISYRHWRFHIRYFQTSGRFDASGLVQSTTPSPARGEGLLDAFDVGAL